MSWAIFMNGVHSFVFRNEFFEGWTDGLSSARARLLSKPPFPPACKLNFFFSKGHFVGGNSIRLF